MKNFHRTRRRSDNKNEEKGEKTFNFLEKKGKIFLSYFSFMPLNLRILAKIVSFLLFLIFLRIEKFKAHFNDLFCVYVLV